MDSPPKGVNMSEKWQTLSEQVIAGDCVGAFQIREKTESLDVKHGTLYRTIVVNGNIKKPNVSVALVVVP
jgi:hypothetical protein